MPPKVNPPGQATKPKAKNKDTCLVCKSTCKAVAGNSKGGIRCSVCQFWYHPDCAGVTAEEYKMCLKWKEMRGADIWSCSPCERANENLDRKVKEVNSLVEGVKKDLKVIGDKQDQAEVREQLRDSKVDSQAAELAELRERMAKLETNSGNSIIREFDERKIRECNIVIHQLPESQGNTAQKKRERD